jgi:hypothetical protein
MNQSLMVTKPEQAMTNQNRMATQRVLVTIMQSLLQSRQMNRNPMTIHQARNIEKQHKKYPRNKLNPHAHLKE